MQENKEYALTIYVEEEKNKAIAFFNQMKRIIVDKATISRIGVRFSKTTEVSP